MRPYPLRDSNPENLQPECNTYSIPSSGHRSSRNSFMIFLSGSRTPGGIRTHRVTVLSCVHMPFCYRCIYPRTDSNRYSCGLKPHASACWATGAYMDLVIVVAIVIVALFFNLFSKIFLLLFCPCACTDRYIYFVFKARYGLRSRSASLEDWNAANYTYRASGREVPCMSTALWRAFFHLPILSFNVLQFPLHSTVRELNPFDRLERPASVSVRITAVNTR